VQVELGDWLPELPALDNPGCVQAKNVIPRAVGFSELDGMESFSNALSGACLGSIWMTDATGAAQNFAGDSTRLYKFTSSAWANAARTATYAAATSWNFEKFGNRCIAVSPTNAMQYYDMASSTTFQNVGGSPPQASYVAAVRDFLVIASVASYPYRVQWSGFNNSELWTPSLATQSDYQDLPGRGGNIRGIVPGEYGVVFQESSIWRMDYTGPPTIFRFDEVETGRGTPASRSIVPVGNIVYYYDWAGFYAFNGQASQPIGNERVDAWFSRNCGDFTSIQGAVDRVNRIIMWAFKSRAAPTYNDRILMYNYSIGKWSWGEVTTQFIAERRAPQLTLDQLDTPLPGGIDSDSIPMDSQAFSSNLQIQAFDSLNRAATFEGAPLTAVIETKELAFDESRADTNAILPLIDGGTVTVRFAQRNTQAVTASYSVSTGLNRVGEACKVVTGRFQRFEITITGGFDRARGIDIRTRKAGRR